YVITSSYFIARGYPGIESELSTEIRCLRCFYRHISETVLKYKSFCMNTELGKHLESVVLKINSKMIDFEIIRDRPLRRTYSNKIKFDGSNKYKSLKNNFVFLKKYKFFIKTLCHGIMFKTQSYLLDSDVDYTSDLWFKILFKCLNSTVRFGQANTDENIVQNSLEHYNYSRGLFPPKNLAQNLLLKMKTTTNFCQNKIPIQTTNFEPKHRELKFHTKNINSNIYLHIYRPMEAVGCSFEIPGLIFSYEFINFDDMPFFFFFYTKFASTLTSLRQAKTVQPNLQNSVILSSHISKQNIVCFIILNGISFN
ncbi:hypothetical protein AGLY_000923, partial [Aphis glycines]